MKKGKCHTIHKKIRNCASKPIRLSHFSQYAVNFFERLVYDIMFSHSTEKYPLSENQSGFQPGYSCINQLLAVTYYIYSRFDKNYEVRGVSFNISVKEDLRKLGKAL